MLDKSLATRYATAFFRTAKAEGRLADVLRSLVALREAIDADAQARAFFLHPAIAAADKIACSDAILASKKAAAGAAYLSLLIDAGRINYLGLVEEVMADLINREENRLVVTVVSALALADDIKEMIRRTLESIHKKQVELKSEIDESQLGGIKLKLNDNVIDGSLAHKLKVMKEQIISG